jgi:hypothetical protein
VSVLKEILEQWQKDPGLLVPSPSSEGAGREKPPLAAPKGTVFPRSEVHAMGEKKMSPHPAKEAPLFGRSPPSSSIAISPTLPAEVKEALTLLLKAVTSPKEPIENGLLKKFEAIPSSQMSPAEKKGLPFTHPPVKEPLKETAPPSALRTKFQAEIGIEGKRGEPLVLQQEPRSSVWKANFQAMPEASALPSKGAMPAGSVPVARGEEALKRESEGAHLLAEGLQEAGPTPSLARPLVPHSPTSLFAAPFAPLFSPNPSLSTKKKKTVSSKEEVIDEEEEESFEDD